MLTGKHLLLLEGTIHRCSEFSIGFQVSSRVGCGLMLLGDYLRCRMSVYSLVLMSLLHMVIVVVASGALRLIRVRSIVTVCVISLSSLHSGGIVHSVRR